MKFDSITTPDVQHDEYNMLAELILLNQNPTVEAAPWRGPSYRGFWGKTVAALKRIMRVHELTSDQVAFYIYRCRPHKISSPEFAKMAVVAKKLFRKYDLKELVAEYARRRQEAKGSPLKNISYAKPSKPKTLAALLKELEADG